MFGFKPDPLQVQINATVQEHLALQVKINKNLTTHIKELRKELKHVSRTTQDLSEILDSYSNQASGSK